MSVDGLAISFDSHRLVAVIPQCLPQHVWLSHHEEDWRDKLFAPDSDYDQCDRE